MSRPRDEHGRFISTQPKSITAAASVLPTRAIERMPRTTQGWQERAWRLWRILGIVHFPTSFKARQVARLGWTVVIDGKEHDAEESQAALEAVTGPLTVRETARRLALNLEVAGEVFYVRVRDQWRVYAATIPKRQERLAEADIRIHGLNPDPVNLDEPDSALRASLDTAEQLRLMLALSRSQDRNRLAQRGFILKPKEGHFDDDDDFNAKLEEAMTAPIADEYAPSAVVPLVVDFPAEFIEHWRHFVMEFPYDEELPERIEATIKQFALEQDMPPELLLGNMDSNHWNAWLSSEENYAAHVEPAGVAVGEIFAEALRELGGEALATADIQVVPDPTELLQTRTSVSDAFEALRLGAVGYEFVREAIGAVDEDAPNDEELELIFALQGRTLPGDEPEVPEGTDASPPSLPADPPAPSSNGNGVAASAGRPDPLEVLGKRLSDLDLRLLSRLQGLAELAIEVAYDRVSEGDNAESEVEAEVERLGRAWGREVDSAQRALRQLGISTLAPEWERAKAASVDALTQGIRDHVTGNLAKAPSERHTVPTDLLRRVIATAGGSEEGVVAAANPAPTFADPQGFAIGVLALRDLKGKDIELTQWRFRYGTLPRSEPFEPHKDADGQYLTLDGRTSQGYYPGDHKGCECGLDPVFAKTSKPQEV